MAQLDRGKQKDENLHSECHCVIGKISPTSSQDDFMILYHTLAAVHTSPLVTYAVKLLPSFSLSWFQE